MLLYHFAKKGSKLTCINLYLTKFSEKEPEIIKACYISIHLTVNPYLFLQVLHMLIIVQDCYTLSA